MGYLENEVDWLIYDDNNREILQKEYGLIFGAFKDNRATGVLDFCVVNGEVVLSETVFQFNMPEGYKYKYLSQDQITLFKRNEEVDLRQENYVSGRYREFMSVNRFILRGKAKIEEVICLEDGTVLYSIKSKWVSEPLLKELTK